MKKLKNRITIFVVALLMAFVFVPTAQAAEVKRNNEVLKDSQIDNIMKNTQQYGEGVYAGGAVTGLTQIAQTETTVTLAWTPASGATGYAVILADINNNVISTTPVTEPTITLSVTTGLAKVVVAPGDGNGVTDDTYKCQGLRVATIPSKITGVKINGIFAGTYNLSIIWDDSMCDGFEAICCNKKGKQVDMVDETQYRSATFYRTNTQNVYSVKVRPYSWINNGTTKLYGPDSDVLYAVPQPANMTKSSDLKQHSINLKWKKVNGASKYDIYVSRNMSSGYKKVATVKGSAKSYKITRFKGKTLDLLYRYHYVKVVTYAKFGKKTVKSQNKAYVSCYVRKVYH